MLAAVRSAVRAAKVPAQVRRMSSGVSHAEEVKVRVTFNEVYECSRTDAVRGRGLERLFVAHKSARVFLQEMNKWRIVTFLAVPACVGTC